ncbi:MAG: AMP-dependent synthetase [[Candidatus Thermochlorobacteriaceae] bacterium GBChlB]|nr:MAG: AMP-dependent synthetase [[Candidatus Thermochlorobacteriaceae] bacterium GBChlB]
MIQLNWLEKLCVYSPDKIALKEYETGRTLTYRQLDSISNRLARLFINDYGLKRGERLALFAENALEHFLLFFAAQKTGLMFVPLNFRLAAREVNGVLNDCSPKLLITEEKYQAVIEQCDAVKTISHQWTLNALESFCYPHRDATESFTAKESPKENDPVLILYTSGTTGLPKGVLYTHKMLFWNSINTTIRLDLTSDDKTVCCMPLFHTGGLNVLSTPFLHRGAYTCLMKKFDANSALNALADEKATMFMAVPTILKLLFASPLFQTVNLSAMRFFIVGGEALPLSVIDAWQKRGIPIRQGFGMTEAGPNLFSLHQDDAVRKIGSIGVPNFYVNVRLVDESGNDVPSGNVGELIFGGDVVTPGYWNNPTETAKAIKDGWLYSGDLAREDEDGYFYIVDRKKNMYISGGENVYPAEVERLLQSHPCVSEVAVLGVPDEKWGEAGKAFIVLKPNAVVNETELIEFCKTNLAKYKVPKSLVFLNELPKNDAGKIDRKSLLNT